MLDRATTRRRRPRPGHPRRRARQALASKGNAITRTGLTPGERLAQGVEAARKADCMKDPGKCAHEL